MHEGSFVVFASRQSGVPTWLPFRKPGSDAALNAKFEEEYLRAETASKQLSIDAGVTTAPLKFHLPGGFGVGIQHTQETAGGLKQRKHPVLISLKKAAIFFQGYLTNLDELIHELESGREMASSYGSDCEPVHISNGDQGHISAEVVLHMYLQSGSESDKLAMLLSELQGEYAFIIYDSNKKQVFAARDPNGKEVLYVDHDVDGGVAFSNSLANATRGSTWHEVLPGHYYGGRNTKQAQQFALTPVQLRHREYTEYLEDMSGSTLYNGNHMSLNAGKRNSNSREDDNSPLSNRSSLEHGLPTEHLFRISV